MTEKHTPGPWAWTLGGWGYSKLLNPKTGQEVITTGGRNDGIYPVTWMGEEMSDADARLIAAAPDLLEALRAATRCLENAVDANGGDSADHHVCQAARAAIAKAEGKSDD